MDRSVINGLPEIGTIPGRKARDINSSRLGVGFETLDRQLFKPEKCYDLIAASGAKWARCQTGWSRCETEKNVYDFQWLDDVVNNLIERGVAPWFNVGFGNILYMPDAPHHAAVGCVPLYYGEDAIHGWCNYISALARHFKDQVRYYEIWNETNHPGFWHPRNVSPADYCRLIAVTRKQIIEQDQDAQIVACIASPDEKFIYSCLDHGIGELINAFSVHPYHSVSEDMYYPPNSDKIKAAFAVVPENILYYASIRNIKAAFARRAPHIKIWQGECGCPSQSYGHTDAEWQHLFNMDEIKQGKWLLRRILTDLSLDIEMISYFHTSDLMEGAYRIADGKDRPANMHGLLHGLTYTPKHAYSVFKNICSIFDAQVMTAPLYFRAGMRDISRGESKLPLVALQVLTFKRNGYPLYAYYLPEDVQLEMTVRHDFWLQMLFETEYNIEKPVLIDMLQNKIYDISSLVNPEGQCFDWELEGLPLADYPLLVTDMNALINKKI